MKPSDFVSTSGQKQDMSQSLLQTEMTDAVNTGIVDRADKSEKSLKSGHQRQEMRQRRFRI